VPGRITGHRRHHLLSGGDGNLLAVLTALTVLPSP